MDTKNKDNKPAQISPSERFTKMIMNEFAVTAGTGMTGLSDFHKRLCQNYFITIDGVLKKAELIRSKKSEKYRDKLPITWENINLNQLALNVVAAARIELDPAQPNHINMMPFKNNTTNQYDIVFMPGYRGIELKAKKYGLEIPDDIIVELVYSTDKFKQIKKDINNKIEGYIFEITDSDNRGKIIGGFYYHVFDDNPRKNKLRYFTIKDIEKRKPIYAAVEFWGGDKDKWEKDEKTGKSKKTGTEHIEGWFEEMCWKTIYRAAYNSITIDSKKIDDNFLRIIELEQKSLADKSQSEINDNANKQNLNFSEYEDLTNKQEPENKNSDNKEIKPPEDKKETKYKKPEQQTIGPGF